MEGQARRKGRGRRKPGLSQHFIKSDALAERLVALAKIKPTDLVIEAGPGNGALTAPLATAADRVIAVEADRTLYTRLLDRFSATRNVTLRSGDFLRFNLPAGPYTFFANIPFARTADIVRKLVFSATPPQNAFIIMESLAAARFLGQPFGQESVLSLKLKARFQPTILAWLGPNSFSPPPSVNSVMLRLESRNGSLVQKSELRDFDRFVKAVFASQNGTVSSLIRNLLSRSMYRSLTTELGFPPSASRSNISFVHWLTVFKLSKWNKTQ